MKFTTINYTETNDASDILLAFEQSIGDRGTILRYAVKQVGKGFEPDFYENRAGATSAIEAWPSGETGISVKILPNGVNFIAEDDLPWISLDEAVAQFGTQAAG